MFGNSIVPDYHEWIAQNLSHENLTVEVLRLEVARRLLEESERNIEQIAWGGGLGMRITFQRNSGVRRGNIGGGFRGDEGSLEQTSFVRIWLDHCTMFAPLMAKHYVAM
ncbi:hypothetical protein ACYZUC_07500 [Pseudomonas sp. GT1P32]